MVWPFWLPKSSIALELLTRAEITFLSRWLNKPSSASVETLVWTREQSMERVWFICVQWSFRCPGDLRQAHGIGKQNSKCMGDPYLVKAHQEVPEHCTWTNESSPRPMFYRLDGYKLCHIWLLKLLAVLQSVAWGLMPLWTSWVCVCAPWAWGMEWVGLALGPGTMRPSWSPGRPEELSTGIFTMISSIPSSLLSSVHACSITQHWSKFAQCQLGFAALERGHIQSSYLC